MKRKTEIADAIEPKIPSLSPFLKEETLDVHDIDKDVDDFLEFYNKFVKYVTEIFDNKEKTNATTAAHFILKFKELNRKAQFRLSVSREKTKETKDAINKNHLTMQNLLYEALHLEKETNSCLDYKSLHEDIDLVSVEEFYVNVPITLQSDMEEHELTLGRLNWELCERKNLSAQIEEAERVEQQLVEEIAKKKIAYSNISDHLRSVVDSTVSLEDILGMPMHKQETENAMAEGLVESLYVIFSHMRVYSELKDLSMEVKAVDVDEDRSVLVKVVEGGIKLSLLFRWDRMESLVTVEPGLEFLTPLDLSPLTKSLLDPTMLLSALPYDQARVTSVNKLSASPALSYPWCQRLCSDPDRSPTRIFDNIRHRIRSRVRLVSEMASVHSDHHHHPWSSSMIADWTVSSFDRFKTSNTDDTSTFVNCGLANHECFYYGLTIRCSKYPPTVPVPVVTLWLVVPYNYPDNHPLVVLVKEGALKQALQLIEVEVNCHCQELSSPDILIGQIARLMSGMELLYEYLFAGDTNQLRQLFIGGKYPSAKRPFKCMRQ